MRNPNQREQPRSRWVGGPKDFAALSLGEKFEAQRIDRRGQQGLTVAQQANKKDRVKAMHAQMGHRKKDVLHKLSTRLGSEHGAIFVGNVNMAGLAKTKMAKSVLDADWSSFRTMLQYKSMAAGISFEGGNEVFSTQTCSSGGCLPDSRPKGIAGLGIREWACTGCGTLHDRDANAAKNILVAGRRHLAAGIPGFRPVRTSKKPGRLGDRKCIAAAARIGARFAAARTDKPEMGTQNTVHHQVAAPSVTR
ncbi:RNA-guided endonuclease InsQ/TnpB family protein [Noviherbaspirillum autotrophicum]|uniref:RNA-guided endonuclease InsQ/TnpB family protein n=1 Tax=Noviherbaspirillum autotrophicum TaxID=709839 RepID=UPI0018E02A9C|nr:RNA-guided endonuclease TnpB family protein [Noviherbaspirillum autotrophicum]